MWRNNQEPNIKPPGTYAIRTEKQNFEGEEIITEIKKMSLKCRRKCVLGFKGPKNC